MSRAVTIGAFTLLATLIVTLDVLGRRDGSRIPTLDQILTWLMSRRTGRVVTLLSWWWVGWHFLAR
jgi:hypothetical protein